MCITVLIKDVEKGSYAEKAGIKKGDMLLEIGGHEISDCLDYRFYMTEEKLTLKLSRGGECFFCEIKKGEYDDLGLDFETYLMDKKHTCKNKCIFCFIDQNPKGMRESIYFKDDDSRLSFLFGNYVTLTNLTEKDIKRLIEMRISPVNISVHTTNPSLRVKMMANKSSGEVLRYLDMLKDGEIVMNFQIVLCKGINDKKELEKSLHDLSEYYPYVESIAVVPSGLTKHREGLFPLVPFEKSDADEVIELIEKVACENYKKYNKRLVYASDEWFLTAERAIPDEEYYEEYPQIENGVGMIRSMSEEIDEEIAFLKESAASPVSRQVSIITGKAAYKFILNSVDKIAKIWDNISVNVICAENRFFGEKVTVAGLLTGRDVIFAGKNNNLGECLYISKCMLKSDEDIFLDDMTLDEVKKELKVEIIPLESNGADFTDAILGL